eukprot:COSAG02_NODE_1742_length_11105_cov_11.079956_2_plen_169_part_00
MTSTWHLEDDPRSDGHHGQTGPTRATRSHTYVYLILIDSFMPRVARTGGPPGANTRLHWVGLKFARCRNSTVLAHAYLHAVCRGGVILRQRLVHVAQNAFYSTLHESCYIPTVPMCDTGPSETSLAAIFRLRSVLVRFGLFCVSLRRLNALQSWLPLCRGQPTKRIVQ